MNRQRTRSAASKTHTLPIIYVADYCQSVPAASHGVTWGLVQGFVRWLLRQAIVSIIPINNRLSAIKVYARLAARADAIPAEEHTLILEVRDYDGTEGKRVNERHPKSRVGHKKEETLVLTAGQARLLKTQHAPTPQGIRSRLSQKTTGESRAVHTIPMNRETWRPYSRIHWLLRSSPPTVFNTSAPLYSSISSASRAFTM